MPASKRTSKNDYDRILKENFILELLDVFKIVLGIQDCELDTEMPISPKIHRTTEREMDLVHVMKQANGERFILHVEFQAQDDPHMLYRNQEYHALLQRNHRLPIRHFVLYLGSGTPKMQTQVDPDMAFKGFHLINISDYDPATLLRSTVPEEVILAVLGNFEAESAAEVIHKVLLRLRMLLPNTDKLKKYIHQLTVLSRLRNLQGETIKQSETMALVIDVENDILYQRGRDKGREETLVEERQRAAKERLKMARKMKELGAPLTMIIEVTGLSAEEIAKL